MLWVPVAGVATVDAVLCTAAGRLTNWTVDGELRLAPAMLSIVQ